MTKFFVVGHAFGARYDLPVPLYLFILGGALVVFFSFLLVFPRGVIGQAPSEVPDQPGRRSFIPPLVTLSWLIAAGLIVSGLLGSQEIAENILTTTFWLLIWIAVPISCAILGDWTRSLNPFAALARLVDRPSLRRALLGSDSTVNWPSWLGWWPAVALYFILACGELIFPGTATNPLSVKPENIALGVVVYIVFDAFMAFLFGSEEWLQKGEVFSVLYGTWGRLGFFRFGAPGARRFGGGLKARFSPTVSRITFVLLLLVSVSFDGLLATPAWKHFKDQLPSVLRPGTHGYELLSTAVFLGLACFAWLLFGSFAAAVRSAGSLDAGNLDVLSGLLPSLLPIAFGYLVAHNADYLLINGQLLLPLLGNPAGVTWWPRLPYPFNDSYEINKNLVPTSVIWYGQVVLIILVHVAAVVQAHNYLTKAARETHKAVGDAIRRARQAEWPWIIDMVAYTMTSLWLLAQPIVKGG